MDLASLPFPEINASLNGLATALLAAGWVLVKSGRTRAHRVAMLGAFGVSVVFLVTYVASKIIKGGVHTPFQGEGFWRPVYYAMLISHILLAMVIVPFILRLIFLALKGRDAEHKRLARWVFPAWFYVSVTGVLVYFFLFRWF